MLSGTPPFYSENNDELFEIIKQAKFDFDGAAWENISNEAKEVISGLLTVDINERWSYEKIMGCNWIKGIGVSANNIPNI